MSDKENITRIMKPILKLGTEVSIEALEAYVKFVQELIALRKATEVSGI